MKILVLGADGMLGHQLVSSLRARHEVAGTVRQHLGAYRHLEGFLPEKLFHSIDTRDFSLVESVVSDFKPDAVINAVGIVKQRQEAKESVESILVNALLPHRLAELCVGLEIRLINVSTDCVFSGSFGMYPDDALHDARDLYGRTKSMGEVEGPGVLTLRTSIIGLELTRKTSLIEWFLAQSGEVRGFTKAIYSGFTTLEMARIMETLLTRREMASGIYNVSSRPIDKYSLLMALNERLNGPVVIHPDDSFECNRSLDSSRFQSVFGYDPPSWDRMVDELADQILARAKGMA